MSDISVTLRSMFLTSDPDIQEKLMVEADKLQKAVQTLVEQINTLGYKKTPWEIKQFLLESSPLGLSAEQIKKCYTPITECNFGVRIENCLAAQNMELLGDLVRMDEKTLSNMPNF